jgi:selT/selW/selH-like putative selenoprotein
LEKLIKESVSAVEVNGRKGRNTSFEVVINGELVFSKLETGRFPDYQQIVALVLKASKQ